VSVTPIRLTELMTDESLKDHVQKESDSEAFLMGTSGLVIESKATALIAEKLKHCLSYSIESEYWLSYTGTYWAIDELHKQKIYDLVSQGAGSFGFENKYFNKEIAPINQQ